MSKSKKQSVSPLDLSVNAVLDVTPRKAVHLTARFGKAIFHMIAQTEIKELRKEIQSLKKRK